jgi:hypothetical protein
MTAESNVADSKKLFSRRQAQWYWKSDPNPSSINEGWTSYSDVESEMIEDAFKKNCKTILVELDVWRINLDNSIAINKHDNSKKTPIKRIPFRRRQNQRSNQERFSAPLEPSKPFNEWTHSGYWFIQQWKDKQPRNISYRAIVKKAANGIITEGNQLNISLEAQEIAKQLLDYKGNHQDDKVDEDHKDVEDDEHDEHDEDDEHDEHDKDHKVDIHRCVINIYTLQNFLYKLVNETLTDIDQTKIDTLSPYCYLLYYS